MRTQNSTVHRRRESGVSLVEVMVYVALIVILGGPIAFTVLTSTRSTADHDAFNKIAERNRVARFRFAQDGRNAELSSITVTNGGTNVVFTFPDQLVGGAFVAGDMIRYEFSLVPGEQSNGIDDNGNGLADEGRLRRINLTQNEVVGVCEGLDLTNSGFALNGNRLSITVTTQGVMGSDKNAHGVTRTTDVRPRN